MAWDELPEGWAVRRLAEVAHINMGQSPPGSSYNQEGVGLPLVGGASDLGELYPSPSKWTSQSSKVAQKGDIIICVRATIGDLNWADREYCLGRGVAGLTAKQGIEPRFLFHYLRSQHAELKAKGTGSTFKQISKSTLAEHLVPLPPLPEQRRIVARIEELMERIDAARRLRAEAAEEATAILPTALAKVFEEAEERGWEVETLGGLSIHVRYGLTAKASPHIEGILFIRITDIDEDGNLRLDEPHYVQINDNLYNRFRVQQDDILIARSGATAGKAYLCSLEGRAVFASYLIRFRLDKAKVFPRFLFYFLHSPTYWTQLNQWKIGGAQPNVNATNLKKVRVPLPPIDEQRRIVEYLDAVQAKVEAIRRYQGETQKEIEAMTGAVLEMAFRGEL